MSEPSEQAVFTGISSKATQAVLADLAQVYQTQTGVVWQVESVGGVDAARRIRGYIETL